MGVYSGCDSFLLNKVVNCTLHLLKSHILHIQHNGNFSLENSIIQSITYGNLRFS